MKASKNYKYRVNKRWIFKNVITKGTLIWDSKQQGTYRRAKNA